MSDFNLKTPTLLYFFWEHPLLHVHLKQSGTICRKNRWFLLKEEGTYLQKSCGFSAVSSGAADNCTPSWALMSQTQYQHFTFCAVNSFNFLMDVPLSCIILTFCRISAHLLWLYLLFILFISNTTYYSQKEATKTVRKNKRTTERVCPPSSSCICYSTPSHFHPSPSLINLQEPRNLSHCPYFWNTLLN